jgi:hypothetical protein
MSILVLQQAEYVTAKYGSLPNPLYTIIQQQQQKQQQRWWWYEKCHLWWKVKKQILSWGKYEWTYTSHTNMWPSWTILSFATSRLCLPIMFWHVTHISYNHNALSQLAIFHFPHFRHRWLNIFIALLTHLFWFSFQNAYSVSDNVICKYFLVT